VLFDLAPEDLPVAAFTAAFVSASVQTRQARETHASKNDPATERPNDGGGLIHPV
jgi:hypothetical protein